MTSRPHRPKRTSASWRRLDSRYVLERRVRLIAIGLSLALLGLTCWLALHQASIPAH